MKSGLIISSPDADRIFHTAEGLHVYVDLVRSSESGKYRLYTSKKTNNEWSWGIRAKLKSIHTDVPRDPWLCWQPDSMAGYGSPWSDAPGTPFAWLAFGCNGTFAYAPGIFAESLKVPVPIFNPDSIPEVVHAWVLRALESHVNSVEQFTA